MGCWGRRRREGGGEKGWEGEKEGGVRRKREVCRGLSIQFDSFPISMSIRFSGLPYEHLYNTFITPH